MSAVVLTLLLAFSGWVMIHTLSYDTSRKLILVAGKDWSDFGWQMPLIRSFSKGTNWPPQNPLFPGEKIRYHFGFYALAGLMEKLGVRIDQAVNIPSIIGFWGMLIMVLVLGKRFFDSWTVGITACVLLLFNGSMAFVKYFQMHGISIGAVKQIVSNSAYPTFGPWDGQDIVAVWNLNIFSNQRHLAPAIALALLVIYLINFKKISPLLLGSIAGILLFINEAIFAGLAFFLLWHFILTPRSRIYLIKAAYFGLPWAMASLLLINLSGGIKFKPGFLLAGPLGWAAFVRFWWDNLGMHLFLIPLGVLLSPVRTKKLIIPILTVFAVPNIWQLSTDMFNNHKLFNLMLAVGVLFTALVLVRLAKTKLGLLVVPLFLFLTFSGVIDFFAFKNDNYFTLADLPQNPDIEFVYRNIPASSVVLNSTWFYHPASLAGRPIYNGYTYFTWSHGHDSYGREAILKRIYESSTKIEACRLLLANNISFVELNDHPESYFHPNILLWRNEFHPVYNNPGTGVTFYDVKISCQN